MAHRRSENTLHDLTEEVHLVLPARPEMVGVARLTAASLAGVIDFTLDEIEDLKIAVAELCHQLIGPEGNEGSISLTYRLGPEVLEVTGSGTFSSGQTSSNPLSNRILGTVTDDYELDINSDQARFRLIKHRATRV